MSLLRAIKAQLGLSVTPANNFTLDASADNGTMKLARGNAGATTQDIMTVDANGFANFTRAVGPGTILANCIFDGTLAGTNPPLAGFGVNSINRTGTGIYLITFGGSSPNNNFIVALAADTSAVNVLLWHSATNNSVEVRNYVGGVLANLSRGFVTVSRAD
jgi:hypothetical protein